MEKYLLMVVKYLLMVVKYLLMMVKCSSMVKWVYDHTLISPSLTSIPIINEHLTSLAHLTIIEKLHRLPGGIKSKLHKLTWEADMRRFLWFQKYLSNL